MEIFREVLKRAEHEGIMDPRLVAPKSGDTTKEWDLKKLRLPPILMNLPENLIYDLQKIMENIHQICELTSVQIIGFTSAIPNQGTSSVITLLSLLMAAREKLSYENVDNQINGKNGKNGGNGGNGKNSIRHGVLVMDGQLRHPSLHSKFGLAQSGGILEVLENELPTNGLIKRIDSSGLKIVTTGVSNNFNLAQSHIEKLYTMLSNARRHVRFIFIDIPPVLAYSEGISLSHLCDGVILVIQASDNRWEVVNEARRLLERAGVNIIGGIINRREYFIPDWVYKII
jgi:Mrp family chromosome partitioning ATPase